MRGSEFAELKAFAAVVERASFARAAEHLGVSPSALSQTIRLLEARLGARLLNRTTRSLAPTVTGEQLYRRIAPLLREMTEAVAEASAAAGRTRGTLRINTLGMAARQVIAPRLGRFHRAHPEVALDIVVDDALSDIVAGRFDAGIRVGVRLEKDMVAVRLTPDVKMVAVASPDYLAHRGIPRTPGDLHGHACINWRLQVDGRAYRWEFEKRGKRIELAVDGPLVTNNADVGVAAALEGLGIAYAFGHEGVDEYLARGELVRVLADWSIARPGLFLYHPSRRHFPAALRAFIDCMLDKDMPAP
ncbi:LysR family transcriptional regulator [Hyalangium minutum]|uniref:Transcriptional regulator, LysR family protein n=1 Tax=Hyalangium minutum TaxID=394096 RepID=A0A085WI43_9BACT|nr:LysR family transcriptional regulator [Hyalangium minutum]KFE67356.1 Transcriptional regulator, LysR family protein [Hyalangium minutum]KFE67443.1 Transcriptional regulator, LysR family protein [Hyalangium minutum]